MSPHAVNSLVSDLVAMAKAMEELPRVQQEYEHALDTIERQGMDIAKRDTEISDLNNAIIGLRASLHLAEVARDDAELRFLELDEHVGQARTFLADATTALADAKAVSEPQVKAFMDPPEGEAHSQAEGTPHPFGDRGGRMSQPLTVDASPTGESATDPTPSANSSTVSGENGTDNVGGTAPSLGVSVPTDPSPASTPTVDPAMPSPPSSAPSGVPPLADATSPRVEPLADHQPYLGKRYSEVPHWVSEDDWIAGGGTWEDRSR